MSNEKDSHARSFVFRIFEIWVEDYKQRFIEKKNMQDSQDRPREQLHTRLMEKRFHSSEGRELERALRDLTIIKLSMAAILGAIVGAMVYIIFV